MRFEPVVESLVQYRARKQAAVQLNSRLLTRAVLYRCPDVARPDLVADVRRLSGQVDLEFRSLSYFAEEADESAVSADYGQDGA